MPKQKKVQSKTDEAHASSALVNAIIQKAHHKAVQIQDRAKNDVKIEVNEARDRLQTKKRMDLEEAKKEAQSQLSARMAELRLQRRNKVLEAKEQVLDEMLQDVRKELVKRTKQTGYKKLLTDLIKKAAESIDANKIVVKLNKDDQRKFTSTKIGKKTIEKSKDVINTMGGAIISSADGSILVDNTFESLIEKNMGRIRQIFAQTLFS